MHFAKTLVRSGRTAKTCYDSFRARRKVVFAVLSCASTPALALDGCKVLLCLAAPSWRSISDCVLPIQELMNDIALGKPFPVCDMSGPGNDASHQWSNAPSYCPPQYTSVFEMESGQVYRCGYVGAVSVNVNGALWSRTWWRFEGDTVTEFSAAAKAQLGAWNTQFDDDYADWLAAGAESKPTCTSC